MKAKAIAQEIKFDFGEEVEFAIKAGRDTGVVCEIRLCPGQIQYAVTWSDKHSSSHYDFELIKKSK